MRAIITLVLFLSLPLACFSFDTNHDFNQAQLLIKNRHIFEARARLQELVKRPDASADIYCALAETFFDIESSEETSPGAHEAFAGLHTAISKDPNCGRAYKDLSELAISHGQYAEAVAFATKALSVSKPNDAALRLRALANSHLNRMNEALKDIDAFIALGHGVSVNYMLRGDLLQAMKRYPAAVESYRKALANAKTYQDRSFNQLVRCLSLQGKYSEAVSEISAKLSKDPDNPELLDLRGQYEVKEKKLNDALRDFSKAISETPVSLYFDHRAAVYEAMGQKKLADDDRSKSKKDGLGAGGFPGF